MATSKTKAGIKTSEFWASVIVAAVLAAADSLGHPLSAETVAGVVSLVVGYAFTRFGVKRS